jgi:hypothetical protein
MKPVHDFAGSPLFSFGMILLCYLAFFVVTGRTYRCQPPRGCPLLLPALYRATLNEITYVTVPHSLVNGTSCLRACATFATWLGTSPRVQILAFTDHDRFCQDVPLFF